MEICNASMNASMAPTNITTMLPTSQSDSSKRVMHLIIEITSACIFCFGFPINFIIIYLLSTEAMLRSAANYFIGSLAVADILVLLWMLITVMDQRYHFLPLSKLVVKHFYPSFDMFLGTASLVNVSCVSIDRLVACLYPLLYETIMASKSFRIITAAWIYSFAVFGMALGRIVYKSEVYENAIFYLCVTFSFMIPAAIVLVSYAAVLACAYLSILSTKRLHASVQNDNLEDESTNSKIRRMKKKYKKLSRELKVTVVILVVVLPFTVCWSFRIGTEIYEQVKGKMIEDAAYNIILLLMPWIVSAINAYLNFMLSKSIRVAFMKIFQRVHDRRRLNQSFLTHPRTRGKILAIDSSLALRISPSLYASDFKTQSFETDQCIISEQVETLV